MTRRDHRHLAAIHDRAGPFAGKSRGVPGRQGSHAPVGGMAQDGAESVVLIRNKDGKSTRQVIDVIGLVRDGELAGNLEVAGGDV